MVVDIVGVGADMYSLPIKAECEVPTVEIRPSSLDFGDIFLKDPDSKMIHLINTSNLDAQFEIAP